MSLIYSCSFGRGAWRSKDWFEVVSPRWPDHGEWVQEDGHVRNRVPDGIDSDQLMGSHACKTYASMVYKDVVSNVTARVELSFDERMAPLIVFAASPAIHALGHRVYREHVEIVLFDEGINIWHHFWDCDMGPSWKKIAWVKKELQKKRRYKLEVRRLGSSLTISCENTVFGVYAELPEAVHVGITGCEGNNRFYNFSLNNEEFKG